jgi:dihydroorotase
MDLLISGGRLLDPANKRDGLFDLLVRGGKVARVAKKIPASPGTKVLDAKGKWVFPGLIDAHVHLREPGGEEAETIATGTKAAAAGGVTSVLAMANTRQTIDTPERVRFVVERARETAAVRVYPVGAVTKGLAGQEMTDLEGLAEAGAKAFSDDGKCVMNSGLLRRALEKSKALGIPLIEHCEDENLSVGGVMNESPLSRKLGLGGIPQESEAIIVARDAYLAQLTGASVHCAHISTEAAIKVLRWAKKEGIPFTAETCPHYLALDENAVPRCGTHAKMKPPLRRKKDQEAIFEALADGILDIIATDHAPHDPASKSKEFSQAPFGIIGLETSFALVYENLILKKVLKSLDAISRMTDRPAKIFKLPGGKLSVGASADIAIFDPAMEWTYQKENIISKSSNSPFVGRKFKGKMLATVVAGNMAYQNT